MRRTLALIFTALPVVCLAHSYEECVSECKEDDGYHTFEVLTNDTERVVGMVLVAYGGGVMSALAGMVGLQGMLTDSVIRMELERHERWFLSGAVLCYVILHSEKLSKYVAVKRIASSLFMWYSQIFTHYTILKVLTLHDVYYNSFNLGIIITLSVITLYTLHASTPLHVVAIDGCDVGQPDPGTSPVKEVFVGGKEWVRKTTEVASTEFLLKYYYVLEPCKDSKGVKIFLLGTGAALIITSLPHEHYLTKGASLCCIGLGFAATRPFNLHRDTFYATIMYLTMGVRYLVYGNDTGESLWPVLLSAAVLKFASDCVLHFVKATTGRRSTLQHLYWNPADRLISVGCHSVLSLDTPDGSPLPAYTLSMSEHSLAVSGYVFSPPKKRANRPTLLGKTRDIPNIVAGLAAAVAAWRVVENRVIRSVTSLLLSPPLQAPSLRSLNANDLELI